MKKIMFNDKYGLTMAVLTGNKWQTRRFVSQSLWDDWAEYCDMSGFVHLSLKAYMLKYSPLKVGDVIAIAQSYKSIFDHVQENKKYAEAKMKICKEHPEFIPEKVFRNKMFVKPEFMPNKIEITSVRFEQIQDISYEDCIAEGIHRFGECKYSDINMALGVGRGFNRRNYFITPKDAYRNLIDSLSGAGTFASNPWVFVYNFRLMKENGTY